MMKIIESATKLVLLTFALTLCVAILFGVFTRQITGDKMIELFSSAVMLILGFYFAYKGDGNLPNAGK
jgi:TRAP-type C4-dicarboxylate transport system permease small subunit